MTLEGWTVVSIIALCLILLLTTRISVDLILLAGIAFLFIIGIASPEDAFSGFSNEGMLTVAALYVVATGLKETGAIHLITQLIMGDTKRIRGAQARIMGPVMVMSAFMNNTPIVASFIPALEQWSKKTRIPVSKILIPLSYAAILGGTCTLIGTSTNLIINGLLLDEPSTRSLGLFEPALIGVPAAIMGFIYILIFGKKLLPSGTEAYESFKDPREYTVEMMVPKGSVLARKTIKDANLRQLEGAFLVEIVREGAVLPIVGPEQRLREHDRLIFAGVVDSIIELQKIEGLDPATDQVFKLDVPRRNHVLVEAVVSPTHPLCGVSIREGQFRELYNAVVIAVSRSGKRIKSKVGDIVLESGDTLLLEATKGFIRTYRNSNHYYLISPLDSHLRDSYKKSGLSLFILAGMVLLAGTGLLSMLQAALLAAGAMLVTRTVPYSVAIESMDWHVLIAIASSLGIGATLQSSGVAPLVAQKMLMMASFNTIWLLFITYMITWILTELISNNAAAVLVFPIALSIAQALEINFIPFVMVIIMAASASFSTPVGYQTNLMVYGPGGYRYRDFLKIGLPLNLLIALITISLVPMFWDF